MLWTTGRRRLHRAATVVGVIVVSLLLVGLLFAGCNKTEPLAWVMSHNIVAAFPDFKTLGLHDLCLKSGTKTIVVTVYDTCGDNDCGGCCTDNKGTADALIDIESYTNARWGVQDGRIQWADLGPTRGGGCN